MTPRLRFTFARLLLVTSLLVWRMQAQVVNDGATNTLNNVIHFVTGSVTVGANGSHTLLIVTNGALLSNSLGSFIGLHTNANANAVQVVGTNSRWLTAEILNVGSNGSLNSLFIGDGARVAVAGLTAVGRTASASSNSVTVSGAGSVWTNRSDLYVGRGGSWNTLLVTNEGRVTSFYGAIGGDDTAQSNRVIVTGLNSVWTNTGFVYVGFQGSGNLVLVTNGGRIANGSGAFLGHEPGASNNQVIVTGPGSGWDMGGISIGSEGAFNSLLIQNGGRVKGAGGGLGTSEGADHNQVVVSGSNSVWTNSDDIFIGWVGSHNSLLISDGAQAVNSDAYVGHVGNFNQVTVTGTSSVWANHGFLYLGEYGSSNTLHIHNGGTVQAIDAYVGLESFSLNNLLHVQDSTLRVTRFDETAVMDVRRGKVVFDGGTITTDHLRLTNLQSQFTFNGGTLITRSATASNEQAFTVGAEAGFAPATWDVRSNALRTTLSHGFNLGSNAANATLLVTNGATLFAGTTTFDINLSTRMGVETGSTNNRAIIAGPGSFWTNQSDLIVGFSGSFNTLLITNGGRSGSKNVYVGERESAHHNRVTVTDSNSVWANRGTVFVGSRGSDNSLLITNGAQVSNLYGVLGEFHDANQNHVTVTGPGTYWTNNGNLVVGNSGTSNSVLMTEGTRVASAWGQIGFGDGSDHNQVLVSGSNSVWANSVNLQVGFGGAYNTLLITNGGRVRNFFAEIGWSPVANSNRVIVTGVDSAWTNTGEVYLGAFGSGNTLLIAHGARVASRAIYVSAYLTASDNQVTVTDPNSLWVNSGDLVVGYEGSNGRLFINDGATVQASNVYVGLNDGFNNVIQVENGTLFINSPSLSSVLDVRRGNFLFNGGTIAADQLLLTNGASSAFTFNGGTLSTRSAAVGNGAVFTVGNGISAAAYRMSGQPISLHNFASGLTIANNSSLSGNGTIGGNVTIADGGTLSPGTSIGTIVFNDTPFMNGKIVMEISKSGTTLTNDQIQVMGALFYAGSLTVSNLGPAPLAAGDTFHLFHANTYGQSFSTLTLPTLGTGLVWTNKLSVNGSIAVMAATSPRFNNTKVVGTNLVFSITDGVPNGGWTLLTATNVALPLTNWVTNTTGFFDNLGNLTLTNSMSPAQPKRFFNVREP